MTHDAKEAGEALFRGLCFVVVVRVPEPDAEVEAKQEFDEVVHVICGQRCPVFCDIYARVGCLDLEVPATRGMNGVLDLGDVRDVGRVWRRRWPVVVGHYFLLDRCSSDVAMGMMVVGMMVVGMMVVVINDTSKQVHTALCHPKGNCQIWIYHFGKAEQRFDCSAL